MKKINYKGYTIYISIAVCNKGTQYIVDEFETIQEAKREYNKWEYDYWYLAAETIDEDGNVNQACWGKTKNEALNKLKKALQ